MERSIEDIPPKKGNEYRDAAEVDDEAQDHRAEQDGVDHLIVRQAGIDVEMEYPRCHEARGKQRERDHGEEVDGDSPLSDESFAELERLDGENLSRTHEVGPSFSIRYR